MEIFWLAVALVVLIVALRKPLHTFLIGGLDQRAEQIRNDLDEAAKLHRDAKEMLAKHQQKLAEGEERAADIRAQADAEAKLLEERLNAEFDSLLKRRTQQAEERIQQEEVRAVQEVRARTADLAARTTRRLITDKLGDGAAQEAMSRAIAEVERKLA